MNRREVKVPLLAALFLSVTVTGVAAQAARSGADYADQFGEGAWVILTYPDTLLPLMAIGILVGLWRRDSMMRAWIALASGLVLGMVSSAFVAPPGVIWLSAMGVLTATLAALLPRLSMLLSLALAFLTGLLAMMVNLGGYRMFELPVLVYAGIFVAANFVFVTAAGLTGLSVERFPAPATSILFRVFSSWIAAILLLFLAFEWQG